MSLKTRVVKLEMAAGVGDQLSFSDFLNDLLVLIDGTSRGLPGQRPEADPEYDRARDRLLEKYHGNSEVIRACRSFLERVEGGRVELPISPAPTPEQQQLIKEAVDEIARRTVERYRGEHMTALQASDHE